MSFESLFAAAPDVDPDDIAARLRPLEEQPPLGPVRERESVTVIDLDTTRPHQVEVDLLAESDHAYFLVDRDVDASRVEVEDFAQFFEDTIHVEVTSRFGEPPADAGKVAVVVTHLSAGVAGYFAGDDLLPLHVNPNSNEGLFLYVDAALLDGTGGDLGGVVAHEFTHLIHSFADPAEDSWVDEGSADVAHELITDVSSSSIPLFEQDTDLQLNAWGVDEADTSASYGAAHLFIRYLLQRTGGLDNAARLLVQDGDGLSGVDQYLAEVAPDLELDQLYADWLVANLLDRDDGPYAHDGLDFEPPVDELSDSAEGDVRQFAADYFELDADPGTSVTFEGSLATDVLADAGDEPYWWSNRGDGIGTRLTTSVEVPKSDPTLTFDTLFRIEEGWDYGYVEVSADAGESWTFLESDLTRTDPDENPQALGPGYSGNSGDDWQAQEVDLSDYAGHEVLLRFEYITDAAVHSDGWGLRKIEVGGEPVDLEAVGWAQVSGMIPQQFLVQLVTINDGKVEVTRLGLDEDNQGAITLPAAYDEAYISVSAVSPDSTRPAPYELSVR